VPWLRLSLLADHLYPQIISSIFSLLSPDFLYVTVVQHSLGIDRNLLNHPLPSNLFLLSQGGRGHIPVLLWRNELSFVNYSIPTDYRFDALFMGKRHTHAIRFKMIAVMKAVFRRKCFVSRSASNWKSQYRLSKVIMAPRGFGRNSYRMGEVLQMGMIPIYVYDDIIWLPYYNSINWSSFAYVAHIDELESVLRRAKAELTVAKVEEMRQKVRSLYETHWNARAVIRQILLLLRFGFRQSDLPCAPYRE
jgi:hypothetical protein